MCAKERREGRGRQGYSVHVDVGGQRLAFQSCFSFHPVALRDQTEVVRLGSECPHLLSYLEDPFEIF